MTQLSDEEHHLTYADTSMRKKLEKKIRRKTIEIQELGEQIKGLEAKIRDAKVYIEALEEINCLEPKPEERDES